MMGEPASPKLHHGKQLPRPSKTPTIPTKFCHLFGGALMLGARGTGSKTREEATGARKRIEGKKGCGISQASKGSSRSLLRLSGKESSLQFCTRELVLGIPPSLDAVAECYMHAREVAAVLVLRHTLIDGPFVCRSGLSFSSLDISPTISQERRSFFESKTNAQDGIAVSPPCEKKSCCLG